MNFTTLLNWVKESQKDKRNCHQRHAVLVCEHMSEHKQGSNEEVVLFAVVFVFLISSVPRLVLNLYEVFVISQIKGPYTYAVHEIFGFLDRLP